MNLLTMWPEKLQMESFEMNASVFLFKNDMKLIINLHSFFFQLQIIKNGTNYMDDCDFIFNCLLSSSNC